MVLTFKIGDAADSIANDKRATIELQGVNYNVLSEVTDDTNTQPYVMSVSADNASNLATWAKIYSEIKG